MKFFLIGMLIATVSLIPDSGICSDVDSLIAKLSTARDRSEKAYIQVQLADYFRESGKNIIAIEYYQFALEHYKKSDAYNVAAVHANLALSQLSLGNTEKSLESALEALTYFEEHDHNKQAGMVINTIGLVYLRLKNLDVAQGYFTRALEIGRKYDDHDLYYASNLNIGTLFEEQGDHKRSFEIDRRMYALATEWNDSFKIAGTLNNLGVYYEEYTNDLDSALHYYERSADMEKLIGNRRGYSIALGNIGQIYAKKMDNRATSYLLESTRIAEQDNDYQTLLYNFSSLAEFAKQTGDFQSSIAYLEKYQELKDSMYTAGNSSRLAQMQTLYEVRKRDRQIEQSVARVKILERDARIEQGRRKFLIGISVGLMVILILSVFIIRQKIQSGKQQQSLFEQEKELDTIRINNEQIRNEQLSSELEHKSRELTSITMRIAQKNEILSSIGEKLKLAKDRNESMAIRSIDRLVRDHTNADSDWEIFRKHFEEVHPGFQEYLKRTFPKLTQIDLRHCAYIRMNLTNKEIARLMNIHPTSVQKSRMRLKKKFNLDKDVNVSDFIINVNLSI